MGLTPSSPEPVTQVPLRYELAYGGLDVAEVAEAMDSSTATVGRQWRFARAFLAERLG